MILLKHVIIELDFILNNKPYRLRVSRAIVDHLRDEILLMFEDDKFIPILCKATSKKIKRDRRVSGFEIKTLVTRETSLKIDHIMKISLLKEDKKVKKPKA